MTIIRLQDPPQQTPLTESLGRLTVPWWAWIQGIQSAVQARNVSPAFSGTITTAKLTALGANGSMVFENGVLVSQTAAT